MANISIYLNSQKTAASLQWEDITVAAQWREGSASAIAEIENADFVNDSARIIADWINQGKIFNKLPIQIFATNSTSTKSVFQGYLDLRESCVFSPNLEKISCSIKKNDDIADIADRADALLWSNIKGFFPAGRDVLAAKMNGFWRPVPGQRPRFCKRADQDSNREDSVPQHQSAPPTRWYGGYAARNQCFAASFWRQPGPC